MLWVIVGIVVVGAVFVFGALLGSSVLYAVLRRWWLTAGVVFTLWQTSGVARAIMGVLSRVYGDGEDRPFVRRYLISFALGVAVAVCVLGALSVVRFGDAILGVEHPGWLADAVRGRARRSCSAST